MASHQSVRTALCEHSFAANVLWKQIPWPVAFPAAVIGAEHNHASAQAAILVTLILFSTLDMDVTLFAHGCRQPTAAKTTHFDLSSTDHDDQAGLVNLF